MSARGFSPSRFPLIAHSGTCQRCGQTGTIRSHYGVFDCEACIRRFDTAERSRQKRLAMKGGAR